MDMSLLRTVESINQYVLKGYIMGEFKYYKEQLQKLTDNSGTIDQYGLSIVVYGNGKQTKHMSLNSESFEALTAFFKSHYCECCENNGYIAVTNDNNLETIEACGECDYFGIVGDIDALARDKARLDGWVLDANNKIIEFKG